MKWVTEHFRVPWRRRVQALRESSVDEAKPVLSNDGFCDICEKQVHFASANAWLRDYYFCDSCGSIPRERAVMRCLARYFPNWRELAIHESSPIGRGTSVKLRKECARYVASQYFPDVLAGSSRDGVRSENLERLTFPDESLDLHVTQDVMEHVFNPAAAFAEIARTLRPGGAHIFTTPLLNKTRPSEVCARLQPDGTIVHLRPPEYHGNPIDSSGALVTIRWGFDICRHVHHASGLFTQIIEIDDLAHGIRAELMEVLITWKFRR
jgi:SAM-dependent methyltransferase